MKEFVEISSTNEELLKEILSQYDGNDELYVNLDLKRIPRKFLLSIKDQLSELESHDLINPNPIMTLNCAGIYLTNEALEYFKNKENHLTRKADYYKNESKMKRKQYDVFISHANADKSGYVDDLYMVLRKLGINIFYDSDTLSWGDEWKKVILDSTNTSEFAIIVISENFFDREWTERELHEFLKRQNEDGQKTVLPLLHNITLNDLKAKYPELADIHIISSKNLSKEEIAILLAKELIKRYK